MGSNRLKGRDLRKLKFDSDTAKSIAAAIMAKHYKHTPKNDQMDILRQVLADPETYLEHEVLGKLAKELIEIEEVKNYEVYELEADSKPYKIYGKQFITDQAIEQMDTAMKLPVTVSGAMMPDAHVGYGLPIGGVLATENAVIPYGVGLDIGCRMSLTLYDVPENYIHRNEYQLKTALKSNTHFGIGKIQDHELDHEILERPEFRELKLLSQLHGKAQRQLGTSGSGNHFVEFGNVVIPEESNLDVPAGNYVGLLAHSGSRGFGATIAQFYTQVAMDVCKLPKHAQSLAWLNLDSEAGQEYWMAMNLAGDYAKACHDVIHQKLAKAVGLRPVLKVENHHNFAWKELQADGRELIVHRKGATPAKLNELGIIPASMTQPGYIVSGKGSEGSMQSASHGAGRKMSRRKAKSVVTGSEMKKDLKREGITLIGGGVDESPWAYKDLEQVMKNQQDLVTIEGIFQPKIVRMDKP